jgi:putative membrane protein
MPETTTNLANWGAASLATTACLLLIALLYLRGWWVLARSMPRQVRALRLNAFLAGLAMMWIAWSPQLTRLTHVLLMAHMAQHLLLMLLAPPLLLLGSPVLVFERGLIRASPERFRILRLFWVRRAARWLTHPIAAGCIMVATTIAWHIPRVFELAMGSANANTLENAMFWASGMLFWWPVILPWPSRQQWPRWSIPLFLLGADLPISVLSAYLAFCGHVVYSTYLSAPRFFDISALNDQVAAAMLMWVAMLLVFLVAAATVVVGLLEPTWHSEPESDHHSI